MTKSTRLDFIDVLRAVAILLMLQGHFIDATLAEVYRDTEQTWFATWKFVRGFTAPLFFTVTGLVFTFLLLRDGRPLLENVRWQKGIRRGFFLIFVGYLLKTSIFSLVRFRFPSYFFAVDVLHCIGLALIFIALVYGLFRRLLPQMGLGVLLLGLGFGIFLLEPTRASIFVDEWPRWIANYVSRDFGSTFTPFPWIGYSCVGAFFGTILRYRPHWAFGHRLPLAIAVMGIAFTFYSSGWLMDLYRFTGWDDFRAVAYNNAHFIRGGHAWFIIAVFMWVVARLRSVPALLSSIGSETLTVYVGHYAVLYGSFLGLSLARYFHHALPPVLAISGAICFVFFFVGVVASLPTIRNWVEIGRSFVVREVTEGWEYLNEAWRRWRSA